MVRLLIPTIFAVLAFALQAGATQNIDCRKLWDLEKELGCFAYSPNGGQNQPEKQEFVMESQFGPTACKASNALDAVKKDIKGECDGWIKERKSDLGTKYRTGTCNVKCDSCGQGLERCMMTGLVHYTDSKD